MSYDGKLLVAITKACSQEDRDFKIESKQVYLSTSTSFIHSLKCRNYQCGILETYTDLSEDFLSPESAYRTDWFNESGTWFGWIYVYNDENEMRCPLGKFVNYIECYGIHCAFKRLHCKDVSDDIGIAVLSPSDVHYSAEVTSTSATSNEARCLADHYLIGLKCAGSNCSRISLICRQIQVCIMLSLYNAFDIGQCNINAETGPS